MTAGSSSRLDALTQDAITLLKRGRADLAEPVVGEMVGLMGDRPDLARQMQRIVALMQFEWPARRAAAQVAPIDPPQPSDVELAAFHVALGDATAIDYPRLLSQLFESARLRAPHARRVLLTDPDTVVDGLGAGVEVVRFPVDRSRLMYERMRVQREHLRARRGGLATVFLDSDVVVNAEPSAVFGEDFDVGLTHRPVIDAPFNGGVIFVAPGNNGAAFYDKALACYEAMAQAPTISPLYSKDLRAWWGDQFALAALVGWRALAERVGNALAVDGLRVRIFPCETHNYTIETREYAASELAPKYFVHFKGARKEMMDLYLAALRARRI